MIVGVDRLTGFVAVAALVASAFARFRAIFLARAFTVWKWTKNTNALGHRRRFTTYFHIGKAF